MVYALLMRDRDEKQRDELDQSLYEEPGSKLALAKLNLQLFGAASP